MVQKLDADMIEDGVLVAKLDKAGGTMTGALTLSGAPSADLHAATKKYVDDNAGSGLGTTTNDDAAAGHVGEFISASRAIGSPVTLTSTTAANIASISLTAGDWEVSGVVFALGLTSAAIAYLDASISTTSGTLDTTPANYSRSMASQSIGVSNASQPVGPVRLSLATTTTVYLVGRTQISSGTVGGYGAISARRMR